MPRIKLTEKAVAKLKAPDPSGRQVLHWDAELKGFGVLCSGVSSSKTYVVQRAISGNTRRVTIGPINVLTLAEARVRAQGPLADFYRGIDPKAKQAASATLASVLDDYLAARKDLKPRTRESYRAAIHGHLKPWANRPLSSISRDMVERKHPEIAAEVERHARARAQQDAANWERRAKAAEKQGWRDAAANHRARAAMALKRGASKGHVAANNAMKVLRALWNYAADKHPEIGAKNPARLRKMLFPVHPRTRHLRNEDLPAFYKAVTDLENHVGRDYLLLLLFTGMRRREADSLRWEDADLKAKVLRVPAERTKAARKLDLPLTDFVLDTLVARRALGKTDWVFPANSESGHVEEPKFWLGRVAAACGKRVSPHDLRRTFITVARRLVHPDVVKMLVNHAVPRDVTSDYDQVEAKHLRDPAQLVTNRLKELCGIAEPAGVTRLRRRGD